jgi:hypothetical protein
MTGTRRTAATDLEALVDEYIESLRCKRECELRKFRDCKLTDEEAISYAALARDPETKKKHPHQYRIPQASLEKSKRRLLKNFSLVRSARSFEELIELLDGLIGHIDRIGELTVYDTALRIGARFRLEPQRVYVHAGTRHGIRKLALDVDVHLETIEVDDLPAPIRKLMPREAEDFLCVYKANLPERWPTRKTTTGPSPSRTVSSLGPTARPK